MDNTSKEIPEKPDPSIIEALYSDGQDSYDRNKRTRKRRVKHDKKRKLHVKKRQGWTKKSTSMTMYFWIK